MRASHVTSVRWISCSRRSGQICLLAAFLAATGLSAARAANVPGQVAPPGSPAAAGGAASKPAGPAPKIECDEPNFTFPESWSGDKVEHTYIIKNTGQGTLEIARVQPSCGCTLAGEFDKKIEPGKTGKVPVALNTQHQRGDVTKTITVESNDTANPRLMLTLKGKVKTAIDMQPMTGFSWGQITPQSPDSMTVTLVNNVDEPMNLTLQPDPGQPSQALFDVKVKEVDKGKKVEVTATLKKPLKDNSQIAQFKFNTGMKKQAELIIPANYFMPPALQVQPNPIYGMSTPGQEFKTVVNVAYTREGSLKIVSVKPSDPAIKAEVSQPTPGDERRYSIAVTLPKDYVAPLDKPANIEIKTDKPDLANAGVVSVAINVRPQVPPPEQMVGKAAPQFTLKTPEGGETKVGGTSENITLVNYWATWCPHCKKQIPVLEELRKQYGSKGVKFLNVSVDTQKGPQDVIAVSKQLGSEIPLALDPKVETATKWGARGWPALYVVNKQGTIEAFHSGDPPTLMDDLKKELDLLLAGKNLPRPAAVAAAPQQPPRPPAAPVPQVKGQSLLIESPRQDIGQQKPGDTAQVSVNVRNNGTEAVEIKSIKGGSEAVTVDAAAPKKVEPGSAAMIKLSIKTSKKPGAFSETLKVASSDPNKPEQTVTLAGTVRPYVEVQPPGGIVFPRNPRTQTIPSLATLVYNGEGKIEYSKPESTSPKFEATIEPILNGPYSKLIVKAKPPLEPGDNAAVINIKTSCKDQPLLAVPVKLYLPPRIEISPTEVLLAPSGRLQRSMVSIRNNGEKSLSILGVKSSNERIHTQFYPEIDGMSYRLQLIVPAVESGQGTPAAEKVTIRTDDPEFGEIVIPIKFSGTADAQGNAAGAR